MPDYEKGHEMVKISPLHHCKYLIMDCCNLINSEWPRSKMARLQSLFMSCDRFPTSLVLILNESEIVGYLKLSEITVGGPDIMIESVLIHKNHRGKGWGRLLMQEAEEYARSKGKTKLFLSTKGQEGFYEKLGYTVCQPVLYLGFALEPLKDSDNSKVNSTAKESVAIADDDNPVKCLKNLNLHDPSCSPSLPPPPPPLPPPKPKSTTIFRDIKSFKTYMTKNINTSTAETD